MEENELYRKNAMERVTSPEQLNDYIHVTSPAIWMILIGIAVILIGMLVWANVGHLDTYEVGAGIVSDGEVTVYVTPQVRAKVKSGMELNVQNHKTEIKSISDYPVTVPGDIDTYVLNAANLEEGQNAYILKAPVDMENGIYTVSILLESVKPISFVVH